MSDEETESSEQGGGAVNQDAAYAREFDKDTNERKLTARQKMMLEARQRQSDGGDSAVKRVEDLESRLRGLQKKWRFVNVFSSLSLFGIIIAFISMHLQLIGGNFLHKKFFNYPVPPLTVLDVMMLVIIDLIVFFIFIFFIALIAVYGYCIDNKLSCLLEAL